MRPARAAATTDRLGDAPQAGVSGSPHPPTTCYLHWDFPGVEISTSPRL
jgi:hypothetical protein